MQGRFMHFSRLTGGLALAATLAATPVLADGGVTFTDIAQNGGAGLTYARLHPADRMAIFNVVKNTQWPFPPAPNFFPNAQVQSSTRNFGAPGIVVFDYDKDGDQDLYVTNGPGRANSLFQNQFAQTGQVTFVDRGVASGADVTALDSNGACAGDIDNDGDSDLFVTNVNANNVLLRNNGNGTFTDISAGSGVDVGADQVQVGCSFGDIDADGRLDVVTAVNLSTWQNRLQTFLAQNTDQLRHSDLFRNLGNGRFQDVSASSGIENMKYRPLGSWTWVASMVDLDQDRDIDILFAQMQGAPSRGDTTQIRGWNRVMRNDGTGNFTDVTDTIGLDKEGGWMGLAFADYDCNGYTDFFSTNVGDYMGNPGAPSSFFTQAANGQWTQLPTSAAIGKTPWGWGASPFDYDNDGDFDVIFHGGGDNLQAFAADNPGALFRNDGVCTASFSYDGNAILRDHRPREENGVAVGDFNNDGFDDIAVVAATVFTPTTRYINYVPAVIPASGAFWDGIAKVQLNFSSQPVPNFLTWVGPDYLEGDISLEINSGGNGNKSIQVDPVGGAGTTPNGRVNRDGGGAIVSFKAEGSTKTLSRPVILGASMGSQDSGVMTFGVGTAVRGTLEVVWPHTGIKNRLYNVRAGEKITFPEIPCSFTAAGQTFRDYLGCVTDALSGHVNAGSITNGDRTRFLLSALRAYGFRFVGAEALTGEDCQGLDAFEALLGDEGYEN